MNFCKGYLLSKKHERPPVATFSIVAGDGSAEELGVAVASKFLAVGAVVPWARAGVGALATQSWANTAYGPQGLELLAGGRSPQEVLAHLTAGDPQRESRQVGLVAADGRAVTFTGAKCFPWAGGQTGSGYAVQGNILTGPRVVDAMGSAFRASTGTLARRLLAALAAGDAAGGDSRGRQSAALLIVKPGGGYGGFNDRYCDLRVDDHTDPLGELARLLEIWELYFLKASEAELLEIDATLASEIQGTLARLGFYAGPATGAYDTETRSALERFLHRENLEERVRSDGRTDLRVLQYLRDRSKTLAL